MSSLPLVTSPPPPAAVSAMQEIPGLTLVPAVLNRQDGPEAHLGPESAGAVLLLQATFVDEERFAAFWVAATEMMRLLADAPGFIRRVNFADGPHYTLIALWRSVADAEAFFAREEHQLVMKRLFEHRWQYTHFAGLWQSVAPRRRLVFCQACDGVGHAGEPVCPTCGGPLEDPLARINTS